MNTSEKKLRIIDNGGNRVAPERRQLEYTAYIPERRSGRDRRRGFDRRSPIARRRSKDRRTNLNYQKTGT
jgi:hypothetical protein